jgi:hypothetical protein
MVGTKRSKALDEPELFATYVELTAGARQVVKGMSTHSSVSWPRSSPTGLQG